MRKLIKDVPRISRGYYAVFRHTGKIKRAHFAALHETYQAAADEAIRLMASAATEQPELQHTYYVVRVESSVWAGIDGVGQDAVE